MSSTSVTVEAVLNPPVVVAASTATPPGRPSFTVHVFRDDMLLGGTKQRALGAMLLAEPHAREFVYGGPVFGFAQVALAHVALLLGREGTAVVATQPRGRLAPLSELASSLRGRIVQVPPPNALKDVQRRAERYVAERNRDAPGSTVLLPFGLHCDTFMDALESALRRALPPAYLAPGGGPPRLWLVAGSAAILAVLARLWPETHFLVVQVGKTVWPDQMGVREDGGKDFEATKYVAAQKFWQPTPRPPPYPSVRTYDAKLWQFVEEHGQEGDYIWNVACDRPPLTAEELRAHLARIQRGTDSASETSPAAVGAVPKVEDQAATEPPRRATREPLDDEILPAKRACFAAPSTDTKPPKESL